MTSSGKTRPRSRPVLARLNASRQQHADRIAIDADDRRLSLIQLPIDSSACSVALINLQTFLSFTENDDSAVNGRYAALYGEFLMCVRRLTHDIAIGWTSVCPSVRPSDCPSVTRWYCIKTAEHIVMLSSPHDSPFILVLCISRSSRNSNGVTPCGAAKQRRGMKMSQFSTNNSLYLRNG